MRNHVSLLILLPILFFFNAAIFSKEELRSTGDLVLLELAPVDPRSLMQGDYMRLRFKLAEQATKAVQSGQQTQRVQAVVLSLGQEGRGNQKGLPAHASFLRLHQGEKLASGERLFEVRHLHLSKPQSIEITPSSFLFQEGHAALYQQARFGMMRLNQDGAHLLVGLADKDGKPITP